jgi:hypothetical protein
MVMFKAKFKPMVPSAKPKAQQQQPQPEQPKPTAPPIEKERGPQHPVREPGPQNPPERAR